MLEWRKQEGDPIDVDETLVEISTDKVDAEVPSPVAGTVVKLHAAEGETVAVGAVLAEISTNGDGASAEAIATDGGGPASAESPPVTPEEALAGAATEAAGRGSDPSGDRRDRRHRHADRRRVRHRGHDHRVEREGRRRGQGRGHGRRDLDRQGRHGAARPGLRDDRRDPRAGRRDRPRRAGDRADVRRRRRRHVWQRVRGDPYRGRTGIRFIVGVGGGRRCSRLAGGPARGRRNRESTWPGSRAPHEAAGS